MFILAKIFLMKLRLIILLVVVSTLMCVAQQDPQFSQNMFNKLANNPGFAGSRGLVATSVLHRSQWLGFMGNLSIL